MSDEKLKVLKRKLVKVFRQTFLLEMFKESSDSKNRFLLFGQQRSVPKESLPPVKNPFGWKPITRLKTLGPFFRYSQVSIHAKLVQLSRILQASKVLWKVLLPQVERGGDAHRSVWVAVANGTLFPRFDRGFNGRIDGGPRRGEKLPRAENKPLEGRRAEDGIEEQQLYTREVSPIKFYSAWKRRREEAEEGRRPCVELPPSQRCRLSCPLPPPGFFPPEKLDFLPKCQPASVRFASLQSEFLPQPGPTRGRAYEMKTRDRGASKLRTPPPPEVPELPELEPKSVGVNKNYLSFKTAKSELYRPPQGETVPKMRALLFEPTDLSLIYDVVKVPDKIYKDEVLVQVSFSGVCGSDLFMTEGKVSCGEGRIILGHEISGRVYSAGRDVEHVQIGDNVAVNPYTACYTCRFCSMGLFSSCSNEGLNNAIGVSRNGGWAEFVVVKKTQVQKIPDELGLEQAALILPLSRVLSAMSKLKLSHGAKILVQGLGFSGCLWASVLHSRGYKDVVVSDKSPENLKRFESLDLNYAIVPPEDIRKLAADVIIECTGSPTSIERSFNVLGESGQMCFFGTPSPVTQVRCIPYDIIQKEITMFGNAGNTFCFSEAVDVAASLGPRYLDLDKLGVRVFDLGDYREAFHMKKTGEIGKILFKLDG